MSVRPQRPVNVSFDQAVRHRVGSVMMLIERCSEIKHADDGYHAPYALIMFAVLTPFSAVGAVWMRAVGAVRPRHGDDRIRRILSRERGQLLLHHQTGQVPRMGPDSRSPWPSSRRGTVLDMGCGRGAVLTAVARQITEGARWQGLISGAAHDQSGNAREVCRPQRVARRVGDRVEIETGTCGRCRFRMRPSISSCRVSPSTTSDRRRIAGS